MDNRRSIPRRLGRTTNRSRFHSALATPLVTAAALLVTWCCIAIGSGQTALAATVDDDWATWGPPQPGQTAPPVALPDAEGVRIDTSSLAGRTVVLIFGDLNQQNTHKAFKDIEGVLHDPRLEGKRITPVFITANSHPAGDDEQHNGEAGQAIKGEFTPGIVLYDVERVAHGDYSVDVLPTTIVIDAEQKIVHVLHAYTSRYSDILSDALLLSLGDMNRFEFEYRLHPEPADAASNAVRHAVWLVGLADRLVLRDLQEAAIKKYGEALQRVPDLEAAHIGLGNVYLMAEKPDEAEKHFASAFKSNTGSVKARLGLARVNLQRGGINLEVARRYAESVLADHPEDPDGHFVMGMIHEQQSDIRAAAAEYRLAAELLFKLQRAEDIENLNPLPVAEP
ncbi:MAG: hypothetical protein D8M59_01170 [Planctomycetes bacterium]|nr:hypothetical protein [Planctomycetota bacterium]NOG54668.1 tetratricopeptide repeat protein [Planctomycetota bacterium]